MQERANSLVTTQAKIIAMTCTHAALKRHDFVSQGFEFDSLVMEESAQVCVEGWRRPGGAGSTCLNSSDGLSAGELSGPTISEAGSLSACSLLRVG